jgi:hypothetical protein
LRPIPDYGHDVAIDPSDMPAYANGQRYLYNNGPERPSYSDPDASWGHRSAVSTREGGGFYGYKLHLAACTRTGLPLAWHVETARRNESLYAAPLLDALHARGFKPETCASCSRRAGKLAVCRPQGAGKLAGAEWIPSCASTGVIPATGDGSGRSASAPI